MVQQPFFFQGDPKLIWFRVGLDGQPDPNPAMFSHWHGWFGGFVLDSRTELLVGIRKTNDRDASGTPLYFHHDDFPQKEICEGAASVFQNFVFLCFFSGAAKVFLKLF